MQGIPDIPFFIHFYPFLLIFIHFYSFLSIFIHFYPFLSIFSLMLQFTLSEAIEESEVYPGPLGDPEQDSHWLVTPRAQLCLVTLLEGHRSHSVRTCNNTH